MAKGGAKGGGGGYRGVVKDTVRIRWDYKTTKVLLSAHKPSPILSPSPLPYLPLPSPTSLPSPTQWLNSLQSHPQHLNAGQHYLRLLVGQSFYQLLLQGGGGVRRRGRRDEIIWYNNDTHTHTRKRAHTCTRTHLHTHTPAQRPASLSRYT